ncbi:hypothetical protein BD413DRAFT_608392 [Trametes elegans]|nr:hypothetical protein BD413DRAFT_608392 [Trametes elegans]
MVAWQDPDVVAYCGFVYAQNAVFLLGLFTYHVITNLDIEWALITRRRCFSPALIPYLFGRYSMCCILSFFVLSRYFTREIGCDVAYKFFAVLGCAASFCSTLNLGLRSYIIWKDMSRFVIWLLVLASAGHAALIVLQGIQSVSARWDPVARSCAIIETNNVSMFLFYLYTVLMDLAILVLTVCGLWRKAALNSDIGATLSEQCLWYCAATFVINIPSAALPLMNLNVIMDVIFSMPATTASVIASSSAVLSLKPETQPVRHVPLSVFHTPLHAADTLGMWCRSTSAARNPARSTGGRHDIMGIPVRTSRGGTFTTNIHLETQVNSSDIDNSFDSAMSHKSAEDAAADAV